MPAPAVFTPDENDIVADMLRVILSMAPAFSAELAARAEAQMRDRWGGDNVYISRRSGEGRSARNQAILRDHRNGERVPLLSRRYSLTERRILQILKSGA
jgi:Mor family transcriptional regulator